MIKYFIFSILIASIIALSYGLFNEKENLLLENQEYRKDVFTRYKGGEIVAGDIVSATIKAGENNLGIIAVRFNTFGQVRSDTFIFRIKEEGSQNWYYTNTYKAKEFGGFPFFPFGFPIIHDSKDKNYIIELESEMGKQGSGVAIANSEPTIEARYKFSKSEVFSNKVLLLTLVVKKIIEVSQERKIREIFIELLFLIIVLPLFLYYLRNKRKKLATWSKKFTKKSKLKKSVNYITFIIGPSKTVFKFLEDLFLLMVKLLSYFYNWLGRE